MTVLNSLRLYQNLTLDTQIMTPTAVLKILNRYQILLLSIGSFTGSIYDTLNLQSLAEGFKVSTECSFKGMDHQSVVYNGGGGGGGGESNFFSISRG